MKWYWYILLSPPLIFLGVYSIIYTISSIKDHIEDCIIKKSGIIDEITAKETDIKNDIDNGIEQTKTSLSSLNEFISQRLKDIEDKLNQIIPCKPKARTPKHEDGYAKFEKILRRLKK